MISRSTLFSSPGGDTIQIINTAKYLRVLNVDVDIRTADSIINYSEYDLIHFFNIIRPADILTHIKRTGIPFVVSTIFVDYSEYEKRNRRGVAGLLFKFLSVDQIEYLKSLARALRNGEKIRSFYYLSHGHKKAVRHVAAKSSLLLPNSHHEYDRFESAYNISKKYESIPNAVDPETFQLNSPPHPDFLDHIICVARIEGRKNQLGVIKAVNATGFNLSFFGSHSPNHRMYLQECRSAAANNPLVQFFPHTKQEELVSIYRAAKVHVLASWFETTGLSTMEAALMGCNIVITDKGDTREYFEDDAYYCDPSSVQSITDAITKAHSAPQNFRLRERILKH